MHEGQVADSLRQGWCAQKQSGQATAFVCLTDMLSALKTAAEKKLSKLLLKVKAIVCTAHKQTTFRSYIALKSQGKWNSESECTLVLFLAVLYSTI